jgi:hypothetical protein
MTGPGATRKQELPQLVAHRRADWLRSGEIRVLFTRGEVADRFGATASRDGVSLVLAWHDDDEAAA